jgi:hypothetical protein
MNRPYYICYPCVSPDDQSLKHHKNASKAITNVKEEKGFKEFKRFKGTNTSTSENSQLLNNSSAINIMRGTVPPIE